MITKQTKTQAPQVKESDVLDQDHKPVINNLPDGYNALMNSNAVMRSMLREARDAAEHPEKGIFVRVNYSYQKIKIKDISFIEALSDYLLIYTRDKRYTVHCTMHHLMEKLPLAEFVRAHRSYIVRMDHISSIEDNNMLSVDGKLIPIGKTHKQEVMTRLNVLY